MIADLVRFLKTPKGLFTLVLLAILTVAAFGPAQSSRWWNLIAAVAGILTD